MTDQSEEIANLKARLANLESAAAPSPAPKARKKAKQKIGVVQVLLGVVGLVVVFFVWATIDYGNQRAMLERAAACSGISADELERIAEQSAGAANISVSEAARRAAILACPTLKVR